MATKEKKQGPTKGKVFWRTQAECLRRTLSSAVMYVFMSIIMLVIQMIPLFLVRVLLGTACMIFAMLANAHLCFGNGKRHYDNYLSGELHRSNIAHGIDTGAQIRVEREYRPWKGFYIGFLISIPVIVLGALAGHFLQTEGSILGQAAGVFLIFLCGWAIIPMGWFASNFYWSILMAIIPILISGISYIIGARYEKRVKDAEKARAEAVARLQEAQKDRAQTEEQRRKTP